MRDNRPGSELSPKELTTEQDRIERSVVMTRALMLCGPLGDLSRMPTDAIRAVVCAAMGVDVRERSEEYLRGAFDTLVDQRQPLPRREFHPNRN